MTVSLGRNFSFQLRCGFFGAVDVGRRAAFYLFVHDSIVPMFAGSNIGQCPDF